MNRFAKYSPLIVTLIIILIFVINIIVEVAHYNSEPRHKVYVEWTVYNYGKAYNYHGTYDMVGDNFRVQNYWKSAGKHSGSYRVVRIVDSSAGTMFISKQSVCIYTGMNDVDVKTIKIIE